MSAPVGIVVVEGADAAGKTTLAKYLVERHGARYVKSRGPGKNKWRAHLAETWRAVKLADRHLVVCDRNWISELVYGHCYRGAPAFDVAARCLDRAFQKAAAVTALCAPRDVEGQLRRHRAGNKVLVASSGKRDEFFTDGMDRVISTYAQLRDGDASRAGSRYLDQLIRQGSFLGRPEVMHYDLDEDGDHLERVAQKAFAYLRARRAQQVEEALPSRRDNLAGHVYDADVVFVGGSVPISTYLNESLPQWPACFTDDQSKMEDGDRVQAFNRALHEIEFDERRALHVNLAPTCRDGLDWVHLLRRKVKGLRFVSVGRAAHGILNVDGVEHVDLPPSTDPSFVKRLEEATKP